jgi:hypothetical protein
MRHLLLGIALAACASGSSSRSTTTTTTTASAENTELVCREETPTGTSISRQVCRTPQQIEDERRAAEELLRQHALTPIRFRPR